MSSRAVFTCGYDLTVQITPLSSPAPTLAKPGSLTSQINRVLFTPTNHLALAGNPFVLIYDIRGPGPNAPRPLQFAGHQSNVTDLVFQGNNTFFTCSEDKTWQLWDIGQPKSQKKVVASSAINSVTIIEAGARLITGNEKGQIELWSIGEGKRISCLPVSQLPVRWLGLSNNATQLFAAGHDGKVYVIDVGRHLDEGSSHRDFQVINAHDGPILRLAVAPDGNSFATAASDSKAKIWDCPSGALRQTLDGHNQTKWIWDVAYTPDSEMVVTAGTDKHLRVWNAVTGEVVLDHASKHNKGITALALYAVAP
jgi:G protein beta subunit-like protein